MQRLDARDDKSHMGLIMVISDTDDDIIFLSHGTLSPDYAIHAFSFCSVDNARAMYRIASRSVGTYGILNDQSNNEITQAFRAFISNITSIVAVNTVVNIVCDDDSSSVKLSTIESGHFRSRISHDRKSGSIYAGALYPGAERRFVVYVDNVREDEYGRMSKMLAVTTTWVNNAFNEEKSDDQKMVIVRGKDPGSKELVEEIIRIEELKILGAIVDPKTKIEAVLRKMQELRMRLKAQQAAGVGVRTKAAGSDYATAVDEESLASLASDEDGSRLSYMLSWLSFQGLCEQPPPPVPAPTGPRRETDKNLPQLHGRP